MCKKKTNSDLALAQLVAAIVAIEFGVASPSLFSKTKGPSHLSFARQVSMYLVHVVYQVNLSRVAKSFCRDRSTVSYACKVIEDCREDPHFDEKLVRLENFLDRAPVLNMLEKTG